MYFFEDNNFLSLLILATVIGNTKNNLVILNQLISYNIYRTLCCPVPCWHLLTSLLESRFPGVYDIFVTRYPWRHWPSGLLLDITTVVHGMYLLLATHRPNCRPLSLLSTWNDRKMNPVMSTLMKSLQFHIFIETKHNSPRDCEDTFTAEALSRFYLEENLFSSI